MLRLYAGLIPRVLWKIFFIINFAAGLLVVYPVLAILLAGKPNYHAAYRVLQFWGRWVLYVPGIIPRVTWEFDKKDLPRTCIFVANHTSYLDIVESFCFLPHYHAYMVKEEAGKAPLLRVVFRDMHILVQRQSITASHKAFLRISEKLDQGHSVFIYPEGTISVHGQLKLFKNGAFRLAIDKQLPIVPITYCNNWQLLQNGGFAKVPGRPGLARVIVHKPVETRGMTEADLVSLCSAVRSTIEKSLSEELLRRKKKRK
ncbi:MAG: 1-acyl-sn-glycerol-3-phosphate acyltransferase [Bacteroidetes bacterium]|nr:MAG: 1-acyl-sn-glycerol-3-phosphate acyltransferase [Bacteroidota bacterium]